MNIRWVDDGAVTFISGADADCIINPIYKKLSIADIAGLADCFGGFYDFFYRDFADHDFHFDIWNEIDGVLRAAIDFTVALLQAVTEHLRDGHAGHSDFIHALFESFQLFRARDDFDFCHVVHTSSLLISKAY